MPLYSCNVCNISTKLKSNYNRHLTTNKHQRNIEELKPENIKKHKIYKKDTQMIHKCPKKIHKRYTKDTQIVVKSICEFCNKEFSYRQSMLRHIRTFCKIKTELDLKESKNKQEIIELKNQVNKLIDKVGTNTTINHNITNQTNTQNNIQLNNFGNEDLSVLTDQVKQKLIKGPYTMMPKLMELIYFNDNFPENQNLKLVNRKQNILKVYDKGKWKYVDKEATINDILDSKNYNVDCFYEDNGEQFSNFVTHTYDKFRELFNSRDKELWNSIKKEVDFILWNNM